MEDSEGTESLNEWEHILSPTTNQPRELDQDEFSIFPPSNYEGPQVPPAAAPSPIEDIQTHSQLPTPPVGCENVESDETLQSGSRPKVGSEIAKWLRWRFEVFKSQILLIASRLGWCSRGSFWPYASVTVVIAVVLQYLRIQRRRQLAWKERENHLILRIEEKDQKINQLVQQIREMKEVAPASHRVPVFRVITNKYLH